MQPLNTGDCVIEVATWICLTTYSLIERSMIESNKSLTKLMKDNQV